MKQVEEHEMEQTKHILKMSILDLPGCLFQSFNVVAAWPRSRVAVCQQIFWNRHSPINFRDCRKLLLPCHVIWHTNKVSRTILFKNFWLFSFDNLDQLGVMLRRQNEGKKPTFWFFWEENFISRKMTFFEGKLSEKKLF